MVSILCYLVTISYSFEIHNNLPINCVGYQYEYSCFFQKVSSCPRLQAFEDKVISLHSNVQLLLKTLGDRKKSVSSTKIIIPKNKSEGLLQIITFNPMLKKGISQKNGSNANAQLLVQRSYVYYKDRFLIVSG